MSPEPAPTTAVAPAVASPIYLNGATIMTTPTDRQVEIARRAGFDGVEVRSERLLEAPDEVRKAAAIVRPIRPLGATRAMLTGWAAADMALEWRSAGARAMAGKPCPARSDLPSCGAKRAPTP